VLKVEHCLRVDDLDGLLRKGKHGSELGTGADGVKSRKETGVARQKCRKVYLEDAVYKQWLEIINAESNHMKLCRTSTTPD
jgi:hypothetical protein